jgi:N-acyl-D-amino-acid deacylase
MKIKPLPMLLLLFTLIISLSLMTCTSKSPSEKFDMIIKNTNIVDGTGRAQFRGDIAIKGERIAAVGKVRGEAITVIDGSELITCPGFIDPHSHAARSIRAFPSADNFILQGITTVLAGNCGDSWPRAEDLSFVEWLSALEGLEKSINIAMLVGHNTVRDFVMGDDFKRHATPDEIEEMKKLVDEAMRNGAYGLSAGLDYYPGEYADTGELIELAKVVAKYGGRYVPHLRHCNSHWQAVDQEEWGYGVFHGPIEDAWVGKYRGLIEAIEVCRKSNVHLHLAHMYPVYNIPQPHPEFLDEAVAKATLWIIDNAREEGLNITLDVLYAVEGYTSMNLLINEFIRSRTPSLKWLSDVGNVEFIEKLKTGEYRKRIREIYSTNRLKLGKNHTKADPYWIDRFKILECKNREYEGKTIGELSIEKNTDALDVIFDILIEDPDTKWAQFLDDRCYEKAIDAFFQDPKTFPSTDLRCYPPISKAQGRMPAYTYGIYADFIGTYVRDKSAISLEEAVKKATSLPAHMLSLEDRGIISSGAYADIVIFDFDRIMMTGTFLNPAQRPEGIEYVLVNGNTVYKDSAHTGEKPGRLLRHKY